MSNWSGKHLVSLQNVRHEAPEFFYRALETKQKLQLLHILELSEALDELFS